MSSECERVFGSPKKLLTPERNALADDSIEATECLKSLVGSRLYSTADTDTTIGTVSHIWLQKLIDQAERVLAAVDSNSGQPQRELTIF